MPKLSKKESLSDSPLLNRSNDENVQSDRRLHSTLHPERLDMSRFSDKLNAEETQNSSFRIVLYVLVVILVGVGLALFIRQQLSQNQDDTNAPEEPADETPQDTASNPLEVSTIALPDAEATNFPTSSQFTNTDSQTVGTALADDLTSSLDSIDYQKYQTFARLTLDFDDSSATVPEVVVTKSGSNLTIQVDENVSFNQAFTDTASVDDLIDSLLINATGKQINTTFVNPTQFLVRVIGADVIIDFKTQAQIDAEGESEVPAEEEPETPTTPDPDKPSTTNLTNEFSKQKQFITSSASGNTISWNEVFYEDQASYFELAWGSRNNVGEQFAPNATAEIVKEGGKTYIDLTVENLASFGTFQSADASNISVNLGGANFVRYDLQSFQNGVAKIRIELKREADFRLVSEPTVSGQTQVLALQIRD